MIDETVKMSVQSNPALVSGNISLHKRDTRKARALAVEARKARAYVRQKSELQVAKQVKKIQLRQAEVVARAMVLPAVGLTFVYKKITPEKGRVETERLTDPDEIEFALNCIDNNDGVSEDDSAVYYYITTKEPDYRAGEAILNRAIGKVADKVEQNVNVKFSLSGLEKMRRSLPELEPLPVEARVLDAPKDE